MISITSGSSKMIKHKQLLEYYFFRRNFRFLYTYIQKQNMQVAKDKGPMRIQLAGRDRIAMLMLFVLQLLLFLSALFFFGNYYGSSPLPHFLSGPTLISSPYTTPSYLYNALIYSLFFVQHVLMALVIFKIKAQRIWKKFPLYERYIYNITSGLTLIWVYSNVRPVFAQSQILFTTPLWINLPIFLFAQALYFYTLYKFFTIIFVPYSLRVILTSKSVQPENYDAQSTVGLITNGIYLICRHPNQLSIVLSIVFASNVYTVDKMIFLAVNLIGIIMGILYEEKRSIKKFKGYKEYMKKVPHRLIPYLF